MNFDYGVQTHAEAGSVAHHLDQGTAPFGVSSAPRWPKEARGGVLATCVVFSVSVHAGLLTAFGTGPRQSIVGVGGVELEAIGVELVDATVLEALQASTNIQNPVAQRAALADTEGYSAHTELAQRPEVAQSEPALPDEILPILGVPLASAEQLPADKPMKRPEPPKLPMPEAVATLETAETGVDQTRTSGSAQVRGFGADDVTGGIAAATPGQLQRYANEIRTAMGKAKPKGRGKRGTVTIAFQVTGSGMVAFAHVSVGSGDPALDDTAVNTIRRVAFPAPPAGMTEVQRTYVIPFQFR